MAELWTYLDTYKELITNGLDLLSFILVTPEVLRVFVPAARRVPSVLLFVTFAMINWVAVVEIPQVLGFYEKYNFWITASLNALIGSSLTMVALYVLRPLGNWMVDIMSRHLFLAGAAVFFVSRLIAFLIAIHAMLARPE